MAPAGDTNPWVREGTARAERDAAGSAGRSRRSMLWLMSSRKHTAAGFPWAKRELVDSHASARTVLVVANEDPEDPLEWELRIPWSKV